MSLNSAAGVADQQLSEIFRYGFVKQDAHLLRAPPAIPVGEELPAVAGAAELNVAPELVAEVIVRELPKTRAGQADTERVNDFATPCCMKLVSNG